MATPPAYRFDIAIEADLIEEVARIGGFEAIPERDALVPQQFRAAPEEVPLEHTILEALAAAATRRRSPTPSSIRRCRRSCFPDRQGLALSNPIASDMSVMRVSLWPGLLRAALENQRRQQDRMRLFEHGARFVVDGWRYARESTRSRVLLAGRDCRSSGASARHARRRLISMT